MDKAGGYQSVEPSPGLRLFPQPEPPTLLTVQA